MKRFLIVFLLFVLGCSEKDPAPAGVEWKSLGLEGITIRQLNLVQEHLYATTDDGIYRKDISADDTNWESLGFAGERTQAFAAPGSDTFLVSVINEGDFSASHIYRTTDGGETWDPYQNGFGGDMNEPVFDMDMDPSDSQVIYAVGIFVIARSMDAGASWEILWGNWGSFASGLSVVEVDPVDNNIIWAGGQNAIEESILLRSGDGGQSWETWSNLVEAPSTVKDFAFDPVDHNTVYAGYEGALIRTPDSGNTWDVLINSEENRFFFGVEIEPSDPKTIFAGGWLKRFDEPQPLILYRSNDSGNTWAEYENQSVEFGGIISMEHYKPADRNILFMGLWKGGVQKAIIFN